jgi:hypothetical protein
LRPQSPTSSQYRDARGGGGVGVIRERNAVIEEQECFSTLLLREREREERGKDECLSALLLLLSRRKAVIGLCYLCTRSLLPLY